jgi:hypothetical protein
VQSVQRAEWCVGRLAASKAHPHKAKKLAMAMFFATILPSRSAEQGEKAQTTCRPHHLRAGSHSRSF